MKRIVVLFFIVSIAFLLYFQYVKYRKFSSPNDYDYKINTKDIDINYYDQTLLNEYFEKATSLGNFARQQWTNYEIDVLHPDNTTQAQNAALFYQQTLARVRFIEAKLIASQKLKSQGFDNNDIALIEQKNISPSNLKIYRLLGDKTYKKGDENKVIWEVQKLINQKGLNIKVDGGFSNETEQAIKTIQEKHQSYPSGIIDEEFLRLLLQK